LRQRKLLNPSVDLSTHNAYTKKPSYRQGFAMKAVVLALLLALTGSVALAHGGGCRKDSLPGQCCHMDHKTGLVHCH